MTDWAAELRAGETGTAWDHFVDEYRALILATIRHYALDYDDAMDVFARVCEALRNDDMRRLRTYLDQAGHSARFTTWLVAVVRNLTVDWFRSRDGRKCRSKFADGFSPLRKQIFDEVFIQGRSHVEAYEVIRSRSSPEPTFQTFLAELRETYRAVNDGRRGVMFREPATLRQVAIESNPGDAAEASERGKRVEKLLETLQPEERSAVELYVMDELPAADIARILGLRNAKTVYNRVYRALDFLRGQLEDAGLRRGDL